MSTRVHILANLAGRAWAALMGFAFVPLYIRFLGMEAFGLIGFFAAMMAVFAVLDLGLGLTVNRELARMSAVEGSRAEARTLLRTLEGVYWGMALVIGLIVLLLAPFIARHWLQTSTLPPQATLRAVQLMGAVAVLRWPVSLYTGALQGLRRQITLNAIVSFGATFAGGGAVLVLWLGAADIQAFFGWQVAAAAAQVLLMRAAAWRALELEGHRPTIVLGTIRATLGFSAGVTGITLLSVVLTQLDKFLLSRLLPLTEFGYYSLAGSIAAILTVAGATVESATFPALARLHAAGETKELSALYHQSSEMLSLLVIPLASVIALFAPELLLLYLRDPAVVAKTHLLLSLLVIGNAILAVMFMPLSLQLAHGWTSLSLYKNIVAVLIFVPSLVFMVSRFGAVGAAWVWIALTAGYLLIEVQVMHRRLLPGDQWRWYGVDVGVPVFVSLVVIGGARLLLPIGWSPFEQLVAIAAAGAVAVAGSAAALPGPRRALRSLIRRRAHG